MSHIFVQVCWLYYHLRRNIMSSCDNHIVNKPLQMQKILFFSFYFFTQLFVYLYYHSITSGFFFNNTCSTTIKQTSYSCPSLSITNQSLDYLHVAFHMIVNWFLIAYFFSLFNLSMEANSITPDISFLFKN